MSNDFFSGLLSTISERGRTLLRRTSWSTEEKHDAAGAIELCEELLSGRGEASGTANASGVLDTYRRLDPAERAAFFETLARKVDRAIEAWRNGVGGAGGDLHFASEPLRQELFRRLNRAPGATGELVDMRADLLDLREDRKDLDSVDRD